MPGFGLCSGIGVPSGSLGVCWLEAITVKYLIYNEAYFISSKLK